MRLINADELLTDPYFQDESMPERELFIEAVEDSPTIDAEPVIRCKDCKEYIPWGDGKICGLVGSYFGNTKPNDFCSRGAKMDAEVSG